jgi:hypothetical protein
LYFIRFVYFQRPCAIRLDSIDLHGSTDNYNQPVIVHFGKKPAVLTFNGNPTYVAHLLLKKCFTNCRYQRMWKRYVKLRHLLMMKSKMTSDDRMELHARERQLELARQHTGANRDCTVEVPAKGFYRTGVAPDMIHVSC